MPTSNLLVIMARYPARGKVKTRLAADIGKVAAARVYRALIAHHVREFDPSRVSGFDVEWRYTPARSPFRRIVGPAYRVSRPGRQRSTSRMLIPQPAGDLGERMERIFAAAFARGYRRVVMIGTDAPSMEQGTVRRALRLLRDRDAVVQPAEDGGYALIGLRRMVRIFDDIPWSTPRVLTRTRTRLRQLRLTFAELPMTYDIDTGADLQRWNGAGQWTGPAHGGVNLHGFAVRNVFHG